MMNIPFVHSSVQRTDNGSADVNTDSASNMNSVMLQYIVPATVAAVASVVAAIVAAWNQIKLQKLQEAKAEQDARRDYEYEARKRLYQELEPLIFLHVEDSENAYNHIIELANMARLGTLSVNITDKKENNYYLKATIYKLIRPMAVFRLMQRHLTSYDLHLEDYFRLQYILAKCLYFSCTDDYYVALGSRKREDYKLCLICAFQGYLKHSEEKKEKTLHPDHIVYNILGMTRGVIDNLANSLIKFDENDKTYRVMTFDEFEEKHFDNELMKMTPSMLRVCELFSRMSLSNRDSYPSYVLIWRILVLHACIYSIMKGIVRQKQSNQERFTGKNTGNMIDRDEIKKRMAHFLKEEASKFRWVIEVENEQNSTITKERMDKDYSRSLIAIEKYLDDWLRLNYENPVKPMEKKRNLFSPAALYSHLVKS
jgi:hypothetical protein